MSYTHSFAAVTPPARFSGAWTLVKVYESATATGTYALIDTQTIPTDPTPAVPDPVNITVTTATLAAGWYRFAFDTAPSAPSPLSAPVQSPATSTAGAYSTPALLRDALGVDAATLPDDDADRIIRTASVLVDRELGARIHDATTGRKVTQADVTDWQWQAIVDATTALAAILFQRPDVASGQRWKTVRGPDFEMSGLATSGAAFYGAEVEALIAQSGLAVRGIISQPTPYQYRDNAARTWEVTP